MKYYILKNWHYSLPMFTKIMNIKKEMNFEVIFSDSTNLTEVPEQSCVNKLFGWSNGLCSHHKDSFRLGWKCKNKKLFLYDYQYINGILYKKELGEIPNKIYVKVHETLETIGCNYKYVYIYNEKMEYLYHFSILNSKKYGYWLSPYFGGESKSPNNFNIKVKKL